MAQEKSETKNEHEQKDEENEFWRKHDQLIGDLKKANQKVADLEKSTKSS
jgi:hypothetical protein